MDPWYRIVMPRQEVRAGHSFNPDEFAIALSAKLQVEAES
jgi:hypothetical protein